MSPFQQSLDDSKQCALFHSHLHAPVPCVAPNPVLNCFGKSGHLSHKNSLRTIFMSCALHRSAVRFSLLHFVLPGIYLGAKLVNSSPATLEARIACPEGTPYEGYTMTLELVAYDGYPFIAPVARFLERVSTTSTRLEDDVLHVFGPFSSVTSGGL